MKQITRDIIFAFNNGFVKKIGSTETDGISLWVDGNKIAEKRGTELWITNAFWNSIKIKERLNGLQGVRINQKNGQWYLNGLEWDGTWVQVSDTSHNPRIYVRYAKDN